MSKITHSPHTVPGRGAAARPRLRDWLRQGSRPSRSASAGMPRSEAYAIGLGCDGRVKRPRV